MEIVLCDDHRLLAQLLGEVFVEAGHTVEVVSAPRDAVDHVGRRSVDVCLMDLGFPPPDEGSDDEITPVQAIQHMSQRGCRVLVLSGRSESVQRREALDAGASGYLLKGEPIDSLVRAVEQPHDQDRREPPELPSSRQGGHGHGPWTHASLASFLTPRERSVLEGLVKGESTTLLAQRLGVRPATARTHVQNLLGKLCVHSRLEAVALAVEHDIVRVADEAV